MAISLTQTTTVSFHCSFVEKMDLGKVTVNMELGLGISYSMMSSICHHPFSSNSGDNIWKIIHMKLQKLPKIRR